MTQDSHLQQFTTYLPHESAERQRLKGWTITGKREAEYFLYFTEFLNFQDRVFGG